MCRTNSINKKSLKCTEINIIQSTKLIKNKYPSVKLNFTAEI